jgi:hypothetical protein
MKSQWYFDVDTVSKDRFLEVIRREIGAGNMEYRFDNWNISCPFHFQAKNGHRYRPFKINSAVASYDPDTGELDADGYYHEKMDI